MAKKPTETGKLLSNLLQTIAGIGRDDQMKDDFLKSWRRRFGGTLLLLMYLLIFYIVVMCLTAYQIQTRVHASNEQGNRLSIWSVARTADLVVAREKRIASLNLDLSLRQDDISKSQDEVTEADQRYLDTRSRFIAKLASLDPPERVSPEAETDDLVHLAGRAGPDGKQLVDELIAFEAEKVKAIKRYKLLTDRLGRIAKQISNLIEEKENFEKSTLDYTRTADLMDELRFFHRAASYSADGVLQKGLSYLFGSNEEFGEKRSSYLFVTLPSEVLIMLIVIAMGTMGSMISITQVFFAGEDRPITFYLFRPLLGAVVAIGVYVIIKAGVIVASNLPVQSDGTTKLNAFFVSFVSLVAGLMSETAIDTIRRAGNSFLRGDPITETSRYASGVARAMADASRSATDLYPFFSVPPNVIDKWLAENETVPGDAQRVIAAWLQRPVRDLFSDIPPRQAGDASGS